MSTVSISYGSLKDASNEAKSVAKKLNNYADDINDSVYNKLSSYGGSWSSNINTASNNMDSKISELRSLAGKYEVYSKDLIDLRDTCEKTDKSVKEKVSTLTATFKSNNGIKNSKIENTFNYFITSISNSTFAGRWLGDGKDKLSSSYDYFYECIEDWYEFEGGGDFLKGAVVAVLEIAIAVVVVIGAIGTLIAGGAVLAMMVAAATLIGGIIAGGNGLVNLFNEGQGLYYAMDDDPATGKRKSSEDTITDTIRTESDKKWAHNLATGIDVVSFTCAVITIVSSCGDLIKKGYKWTTGCTDALEDINLRNILTKSNFRDFTGKLNTTIRKGWTETTSALSRRDWSYLRNTGYNFTSDFWGNLKGNYADFSTKDKKLKSAKNILEGVKGITENGLNFGNVIKSIAIPSVPIANLPFASGASADGISFGDFIEIYDKFKAKVVDSSLFTNDSLIDNDILQKLSKKSNIKIEIPAINIPEININRYELKIA